MNTDNYINFNFDVSAYRLIGRELITDRITALFELVKNAYDANADNVEVEFINISKKSKESKIIIKDDGLGMNLSDLKNKWMVIGTSSKRRERTSPEPYNRKVTGKKGIGRFAVDMLGSKLTLKTKKKGSYKWIVLETDWTKFSDLETKQLTLPFGDEKEYFTDVKNKYWYEDAEKEKQGTILIIEYVNDEWTDYDIIRTSKELAKIKIPTIGDIEIEYPFNISIKSPYENYENIKSIPLSNIATISVKLEYNLLDKTQETLFLENGELKKQNEPIKIFGPISFHLYYFNQNAKKAFKNKYEVDIDGVKVYRDGIITTPFAETADKVDKQKDIIGLDKRRYSGFFDRLGSRDIMGYVEITDEHNSNIIDATNRQDFLDNLEWKRLKEFIIQQIEQIEHKIIYDRNQIKKVTTSNLVNATDNLKSIRSEIDSISKEDISPEVKTKLDKLGGNIGKLQGVVNRGIKAYTDLEDEIKRKENIYSSLLSLQTFTVMFSHISQHTIGHIIRDAEYFKNHFPNEKLNDRFKLISQRIFDNLMSLSKGVDFMLKYAKSDTNKEEINLKELINNLFVLYKDAFQNENIIPEVSISTDLILLYNRKALEDIFDNLVSNSIKALRNTTDKKIKCSGFVEDDKLILYFSDNGEGIDDDDKYRVFDVFFTRTAEIGGAGLGLYMVKTRIESMQGSIEVVDNEFKPTGATFKITIPFKK